MEGNILNRRQGGRDRKDAREHRLNEEIDGPSVRLVGGESEPRVVSLAEALQMAKDEGVDLIEISKQDMSIVKISDYSKFRFEQIKKAKEAKKKQKVVHIKEVKLRPSIDDHDYSHKVKHAREFLEKGDKVKVTMMFRGREIVYSELGLRVMEKMQGELADCAVVERRPLVEGKSMTMFLAPGVSQSAKIKKTDIDREENNA